MLRLLRLFFFFNDTATTEIYTLSLHDALPIYPMSQSIAEGWRAGAAKALERQFAAFVPQRDRKSTRLNSSHGYISYAVFCLKKKQTRRHVHVPPQITRVRHSVHAEYAKFDTRI